MHQLHMQCMQYIHYLLCYGLCVNTLASTPSAHKIIEKPRVHHQIAIECNYTSRHSFDTLFDNLLNGHFPK